MEWLNLLSYFWGGVFLANAIPHFVAGIMGSAGPCKAARPFQWWQYAGTMTRQANCFWF